jgi:hypothetical protein
MPAFSAAVVNVFRLVSPAAMLTFAQGQCRASAEGSKQLQKLLHAAIGSVQRPYGEGNIAHGVAILFRPFGHYSFLPREAKLCQHNAAEFECAFDHRTFMQ